MAEFDWVTPRDITDIDDCYFYHTMDIPGHGEIEGEWDLRGKEDIYLGNSDFKGKTVLELGTANGFLCFAMEKAGAEVVAYDLSDEEEWDIVPYYGKDYAAHIAERKTHMRKINNGYWLAHKALNSKAKVAYGTVYDLPEDIGEYDIGTMSSILLHLRDPFLALQKLSTHVKETLIVTELAPPGVTENEYLASSRMPSFWPNAAKREPFETWWKLPPGLISEYLQILGFADIDITYHTQSLSNQNKEILNYTVVGRRKGVAGSKAGSAQSSSTYSEDRAAAEMTLENVGLKTIIKHLLKRVLRKIGL